MLTDAVREIHSECAADVLVSALRKYPTDRLLLLEQADLAEQHGDFVQAVRSLRAATETDPKRDLADRTTGTNLLADVRQAERWRSRPVAGGPAPHDKYLAP